MYGESRQQMLTTGYGHNWDQLKHTVSSKMKAVLATLFLLTLTDASKIVCNELTFGCKYNQDMCIPIEWVCDGSKDCFDGSDEPDFCDYNLGSSSTTTTTR